MRFVVFTALLFTFVAGSASQASVPPETLPALTSHWEDAAQRAVFVVRGQRYHLRITTQPAAIRSIRVDDRDLLGPDGAKLAVTTADGTRYVVCPAGEVPDWLVHTGQSMKPATSSAARMNVWRASPHYWEIRLRDIPFVRAGEPGEPLRGEIALHAHPDRLHVQLLVPGAAEVRWDVDLPAGEVRSIDDRSVLLMDRRCAVLAPPRGEFADAGKTWTAKVDGNGSAVWVLRPGDDTAVFSPELHPLRPEQFAVDSGGRWIGYDPASGLYRMESSANRATFTFEHAWKVPSRRIVTPLRIAGEIDQSRRITISCATGLGNLEAGMVTDPAGMPVPLNPFVCKNFDGEKEEPDDSAYGDIVFPITVEPGAQLDLRVMGLFQTWGDHMLKQVSSIRFFHIYWHLSHGLSETTCFTHQWMTPRGVFVSIPDFRPYSGPFLVGQPQHDCHAWPAILSYRSAGKDIRPLYDHTTFRSIAPNLAEFTMHFRTSDDAGRIRMDVLEIPQTDEARTFLRLRYDWDKPAAIDDDARENFRWLSVYEKQRPRELLWLDSAGQPRRIDVPAAGGDKPILLADPLSTDGPFAGAHDQRDHFSTLVLVRSFKARLGGRDLDSPHLSARFTADNGRFWFGADRPSLALQPGDFVEAELMLMPHAEPTPPLAKPQRERQHWFAAPPKVLSVARGTKVRDFPATIRADADAAAFTVTGGLNRIPIVVTGVSDRTLPMLWRDRQWQDQQQHGGDGWQADCDDAGYRFTFVYPIRGDEKHDLAFSLLRSGLPIESIRDDNGHPVVTAGDVTEFSTTSPATWFPGRNTWTAGAKVATFSGRAKVVRAVPVWLRPRAGAASLDVLEWSVDGLKATAETRSPTELVVTQLAESTEHQVSVSGRRQALRTTPRGELTIGLPAGRSEISVIREGTAGGASSSRGAGAPGSAGSWSPASP